MALGASLSPELPLTHHFPQLSVKKRILEEETNGEEL
jgi:hypothetical protein